MMSLNLGTFGAWPAWVTAPLLLLSAYALGFVLTRVVVWMSLWRYRRSAGKPWIERARLAYPARHAASIYQAGLPALLGMIAAVFAPTIGLSATPWGAFTGLAAYFGVIRVADRLERSILSVGRTTGVSLRIMLVTPMILTLAVLLAFVPMRWGWAAVADLAFGTAMLTLHTAGGSMLVLRRLGLARPARPRLQAIVDEAATRLAIHPRATFEIDSPQTNAMAWTLPRLLIYTGPIVEHLDDAELSALTAHELGHLNEPWGVYLTRLAVPYLIVAAVAGIPLGGSFGLIAGLAPVCAMFVGFSFLNSLARRMEVRSDALATSHQGGSEGVYARALEKIYELNLMPVVMRGKRTIHPHLYDRMVAAGVSPAYPRPKPPAAPWAVIAPLLLVGACFGVFLASFTTKYQGSVEQRAAARLSEKAFNAFQGKDYPAAIRFYHDAAEADRTQPLYPANLAAVLIHLGRLEEAESALQQAEFRAREYKGDRNYASGLIKNLRASLPPRSRPSRLPVGDDPDPDE